LLPEVTFGPVTRARLALYAGASGDHNPIHIDSDFAKQAGMNDVFAHGMLSMAVAARLITDWAKIERVKSIGVRFQFLTFVGDKIVCSGEVSDEFEEAGERLLRIDISARTSPETVTLVGQAIVIAN
jgi:acyl dehydratase